jgi:hypothetical protein
MHPEAYQGFQRLLNETEVDRAAPLSILDIGGQNVNGSVHDLFLHPDTTVTTLDIENADIIADATTWEPDRLYDMVIATEVFEHVEGWREVVKTARKALQPWGIFLTTCASLNRPPHGATGAPLPEPGEWYENVDPVDLDLALGGSFHRHSVRYQYPPGDAYGWGMVG